LGYAQQIEGASIVLTSTRKGSLRFAVTLAFAAAISATANCQAPTPAAPGSVKLQPYTAPDKSASAGVPSGWKVTSGKETEIDMTGPEGEAVSLGRTLVAMNAPFKVGQKSANGIDLSMPYTASLEQKLGMIITQNAAIAGKPAPQLSLISSTPFQLPPAAGQCGRIVAGISTGQDRTEILAIFCSLPLDAGGAYKSFMLYAQAPAAVAAQSAPVAQAIFQSYSIPAAWLKKKLAPHFLPPPASAKASQGARGGGAISPIPGEGDDPSICFDLVVLRDTPKNKLPKSCGGTAPN
jgi:hypothetical protein